MRDGSWCRRLSARSHPPPWWFCACGCPDGRCWSPAPPGVPVLCRSGCRICNGCGCGRRWRQATPRLAGTAADRRFPCDLALAGLSGLMRKIVSIQSWVACGHVGNAAAMFPLQRLGAEVMAIHTAQLSNHPGHGAFTGRIAEPAEIAALVQDWPPMARWHNVTQCYPAISATLASAM